MPTATADVVKELEFDFVTDEDPPPPKPRAKPKGVWDRLVERADDAAQEAKKKRKKAPWLVSAKPDADGIRHPNVTTQVYYNLKKKYGQGSEFHVANGYFFEFSLADRQAYGKNNTSAHGVLWVRRVDPAQAKTA